MKAEIGKRKLDLLSRIINSSTCLAYRKLFACHLIKWKWRNKYVGGFIPDVIKVRNAIDKKEHLQWINKISGKSGLEFYLAPHPSLHISKWYEAWKYSATDKNRIIDVIRLICGSLTINNNRLGNPGTMAGVCSACKRNYTNPMQHAILFCSRTEHVKEKWWTWITNNLPFHLCRILNFLDDNSLICTLLGDTTAFS